MVAVVDEERRPTKNLPKKKINKEKKKSKKQPKKRGEGASVGGAAVVEVAAGKGVEEEVVVVPRPSSSSSSSTSTPTTANAKADRKRRRGDGSAAADDDFESRSSSSSSGAPKKGPSSSTSSTSSGDGGGGPPPPPPPSNNNTFASIRPPLSPSVLSFLSTPPYDYPTPTPVQSTTIPLFLTHRDVLVRAVTGSGKTLAFLVPVVEMILRRTNLLRRNQIGALILEPTRELARQTHGVCADLCGAVGMTPPLLLVGGGGGGGGGDNNRGGGGGGGGGGGTSSAVARDLRRFAELRSDVIVGTPGRVEDVLTRYGDVDVSELEVLILDESDVLLDMGFEVAITSILGRLPRMRRTGLFSATNTNGVRRLCVRSGMRNPVVVDVAISSAGGPAVVPPAARGGATRNEEDDDSGDGGGDDDDAAEEARDPKRRRDQQQQATPASLTNYYLICPLDEKLCRLASFLSQHPSDKVIIFFLTCACVEYYASVLGRIRPPCPGYEYVALHGKLAQRRRERAMEVFRGGDRCSGGGPGGDDDAGDGDGTSGSASASAADAPTTAARTTAGRALLCTDVASRGLDVPDVSWTVQFDAPVDPSSYVHRVGRSARAGKAGKSLVFLTRKEESYVDFLRLRKVPVGELPDAEVCKPPSSSWSSSSSSIEEVEADDARDDKMMHDEGEDGGGDGKDGADSMDVENLDDGPSDGEAIKSIDGAASTKADSRSPPTTARRVIKSAAGPDVFVPDILPSILKLVLKDRDILEKGTKAYTSYIRAYKEHHCGFIFRFASLDLGLLATSFSLLRLPKMPELRDKKLNFVPAGPEVNIHAIPFKDKARESARQKRLASELAAGGKNAKQIKAEQRAAERIAKSKERRAGEIAKGRNPHRKKGKQARIFDEWDELAREERLYKKLRQKKITKEEYDRQMYGGDDGAGGGADESSGGDSD